MVKKRIYGEKVDFKSLSCAPVNELGVVYLFGVLHETFGFKIESIQAGFPDCIARRKISANKWQELKIEFEYRSKSFQQHKHDPKKADMIVCWEHNWDDCPEHIEVIELVSFVKDAEELIKSKKKLSAWNKFCGEKRKEGYSFKKIAELWRKEKDKKSSKKSSKKKPTEYQKFLKEKIAEGKTFKQIGKLWQEKKQKSNP